MKIIKSAALAALLSTSLITSPALAAVTLLDSTPAANPDGLNDANLATAQAQCTAAAAALDTDGSSPQSDLYFGAVVQSAPSYVSGPTEVGTHSIADATGEVVPGDGATFTPAHTDILGDPYRIGGSVNMFGIQEAVGGRYSSSAYDFRADFNTVYNVAYTCDITMQNYIPAHTVHHDAEGIYVTYDDGNGADEAATRANCAQYTDHTQPWWGQQYFPSDSVRHCQFQGTPASDEQIDETWEDAVPVGNVPGGSFDQTQTDPLNAHESQGEGYSTSETLLIGQVVVCISPSTTTKKLPGAWTAKNGYTGDKCTTAWYSGTSPYSLSNYAGTNTPNLNDGSHNWVTVPVN